MVLLAQLLHPYGPPGAKGHGANDETQTTLDSTLSSTLLKLYSSAKALKLYDVTTMI